MQLGFFNACFAPYPLFSPTRNGIRDLPVHRYRCQPPKLKEALLTAAMGCVFQPQWAMELLITWQVFNSLLQAAMTFSPSPFPKFLCPC